MKFTSTIILVLATSASAFTASPRGWGESTNAAPTTKLDMTAPEPSKPTTFREAEVLGLRLMQEGSFEEALDGKHLQYYDMSMHIYIYVTSDG